MIQREKRVGKAWKISRNNDWKKVIASILTDFTKRATFSAISLVNQRDKLLQEQLFKEAYGGQGVQITVSNDSI
ncbi:hypothetical protein UNDYM_0742 [Undibacterium sp. YM2]|nr:hypothetical protein UNDYM_0742 [Undibacterium sp. YM2]